MSLVGICLTLVIDLIHHTSDILVYYTFSIPTHFFSYIDCFELHKEQHKTNPIPYFILLLLKLYTFQFNNSSDESSIALHAMAVEQTCIKPLFSETQRDRENSCYYNANKSKWKHKLMLVFGSTYIWWKTISSQADQCLLKFTSKINKEWCKQEN